MNLSDEDAFVGEESGVPHRRLWISRDAPNTSNTTTRGWQFAYEERLPNGDWQTSWDTWEEWFFEILRYPSEFASGPLIWRRLSTGGIVDLAALQAGYDGKAISSDQTPESAGLVPPN